MLSATAGLSARLSLERQIATAAASAALYALDRDTFHLFLRGFAVTFAVAIIL